MTFLKIELLVTLNHGDHHLVVSILFGPNRTEDYNYYKRKEDKIRTIIFLIENCKVFQIIKLKIKVNKI
jgi:hypothetical protein